MIDHEAVLEKEEVVEEEDVVTEAIHAVVAHSQDLDPGLYLFRLLTKNKYE